MEINAQKIQAPHVSFASHDERKSLTIDTPHSPLRCSHFISYPFLTYIPQPSRYVSFNGLMSSIFDLCFDVTQIETRIHTPMALHDPTMPSPQAQRPHGVGFPHGLLMLLLLLFCSL